MSIILAATSPAVALAAIGSTLCQQKRALNHDREMRDLDYQRALVDDSAVVLTSTRRALSALPEAIDQRRSWFDDQVPPAFSAAEEAAEAMKVMLARLTLRRQKTDPVVEVFREAVDATTAVVAMLPAVIDGTKDPVSVRIGVNAQRQRYDGATERFIAVVSTIVGAKHD